MTQRLHIGFVSPVSAEDRRGASGTPYSIAQSLQTACGNVTDIGLIPAPVAPLWKRVLWRVEKKITGKAYRWATDNHCLEHRAAELTSRLAETPCDLLFNCMENWSLAGYNGNTNVCVCTDATFIQRREMGWYKSSLNLPERSIRASIAAEKRIMRAAKMVCVTSDWAAKSVIDDYGVSPDQVSVIPLGANFDDVDILPCDEVLPVPASDGLCRLIFMGVDWQRKGGDIAVEAVQILNARGFRAELIVCGCSPEGPMPPYVRPVGFFDKNTKEGRKQLMMLLRTGHFLFVPSRSEALGMVYSEACAFGMPSIATDVGGVSMMVHEGVSGHLLPLEATGKDYAAVIEQTFSDSNAYAQMRQAARDAFDTQLNWREWGKKCCSDMKAVLPENLATRTGPAELFDES